MSDDRIRRVIKIIQLLQLGNQNLASLSKSCGVHVRTIQRDLAVLRSCIPFIFDDTQGRYKVLADLLLPGTRFTREEALALLTLCLETASKNRIPFFDAVNSAAVKLYHVLPEPLRCHFNVFADVIQLHREPVNPLDEARQVFHDLLDARQHCRSVRIRYKGPLDPEPFSTLLNPYHFLFARRSWYVIGRSSLHVQVRTFHVGRILGMEKTESVFKIPRGFTLKQYLRNAWHMIPEPGKDSEVVIRFSRLVAQNVSEVHWHPTQRIVAGPDGSVDFHATVSGLNEISWWILGYGKEAEVLAPETLRRKIRDHIMLMAESYGLTTELETPPDTSAAGKTGTG